MAASLRRQDAGRCKSMLTSNLKLALNYAVQCGYINHNPLQTVTTKVIGGEEESRERVLTDDGETVWNSQQKILKFLLLTGLRISEAQHGHQDGDKFHIARTKNGDPHGYSPR